MAHQSVDDDQSSHVKDDCQRSHTTPKPTPPTPKKLPPPPPPPQAKPIKNSPALIEPSCLMVRPSAVSLSFTGCGVLRLRTSKDCGLAVGLGILRFCWKVLNMQELSISLIYLTSLSAPHEEALPLTLGLRVSELRVDSEAPRAQNSLAPPASFTSVLTLSVLCGALMFERAYSRVWGT